MMSCVFLVLMLSAAGADGDPWVDIPCPSADAAGPPVTRIFPVQPQDAPAFMQIAARLLGDDVKIVTAGQAVIVVAPAPSLDYLAKVAGAALQPEKETVTEVFRVTPEDAPGLAAILSEIFLAQGPRTPGRGDRIVPDPERGLIVVRAAKDTVREIGALLEELQKTKPHRPAVKEAPHAVPEKVAKPAGTRPTPTHPKEAAAPIVSQETVDKVVATIATAGKSPTVRFAAGKLSLAVRDADPNKLIAALRESAGTGANLRGIILTAAKVNLTEAKASSLMAAQLSIEFSGKGDPAATSLVEAVIRSTGDAKMPLRKLDLARMAPEGWKIRIEGEAVSREAAQHARDAILHAVASVTPHPRAEELAIQEEKGGIHLVRLSISTGS